MSRQLVGLKLRREDCPWESTCPCLCIGVSAQKVSAWRFRAVIQRCACAPWQGPTCGKSNAKHWTCHAVCLLVVEPLPSAKSLNFARIISFIFSTNPTIMCYYSCVPGDERDGRQLAHFPQAAYEWSKVGPIPTCVLNLQAVTADEGVPATNEKRGHEFGGEQGWEGWEVLEGGKGRGEMMWLYCNLRNKK